MRHKGDAARHSTGSMIPFASLLGSNPQPSTSGLPLSVPQPPKGPVASTVFDPAPGTLGGEEAQAAGQAGPGEAASTEPGTDGKADAAVADGDVASGLAGGVTGVQQAAAMAAEEDLQAAEHFAAEAVQSPKVGDLLASGQSVVQPVNQSARHSWVEQLLCILSCKGQCSIMMWFWSHGLPVMLY